ncbi:hypothetical protein Fcan01_08578 [Folsomia candida]|uniref:Transmembrane protein n=1 Tax=Folsomia candida TaxID=158441 RepID=A0A226EF27_FOLCA|nr:hypothetical protein Fcan01_08578 [Folsomia candida]
MHRPGDILNEVKGQKSEVQRQKSQIFLENDTCTSSPHLTPLRQFIISVSALILFLIVPHFSLDRHNFPGHTHPSFPVRRTTDEPRRPHISFFFSVEFAGFMCLSFCSCWVLPRDEFLAGWKDGRFTGYKTPIKRFPALCANDENDPLIAPPRLIRSFSLPWVHLDCFVTFTEKLRRFLCPLNATYFLALGSLRRMHRCHLHRKIQILMPPFPVSFKRRLNLNHPV